MSRPALCYPPCECPSTAGIGTTTRPPATSRVEAHDGTGPHARRRRAPLGLRGGRARSRSGAAPAARRTRPAGGGRGLDPPGAARGRTGAAGRGPRAPARRRDAAAPRRAVRGQGQHRRGRAADHRGLLLLRRALLGIPSRLHRGRIELRLRRRGGRRPGRLRLRHRHRRLRASARRLQRHRAPPIPTRARRERPRGGSRRWEAGAWRSTWARSAAPPSCSTRARGWRSGWPRSVRSSSAMRRTSTRWCGRSWVGRPHSRRSTSSRGCTGSRRSGGLPPRSGRAWTCRCCRPPGRSTGTRPSTVFGGIVAAIPPPLAIGTVVLEDGEVVKGFLCEAHAVATADDISQYGGWRAYLAGRGGAS